MKRMKKLFAILMTMAMVMGLGITGFAATTPGENVTASNGKITVKNLTKESTDVSIYKIVEYNDTNGEWQLVKPAYDDFVSDLKQTPITIQWEDLKTYVVNPVNNITANATQKVTEGTAEFDNLGIGAYLVVASGETTSYNVMGSFTYGYDSNHLMVATNIELDAKGANYPVYKEFADGSEQFVALGDTVTYDITTVFPSFAETDNNRQFWIEDQPEGLQITNIDVYVANQEIDETNYTLTKGDTEEIASLPYEGNVRINFKSEYIGTTNAHAASDVKVVVTAKVVEIDENGQFINKSDTNKASTPSIPEEGDTGSITIRKVDGDNHLLKGAVFNIAEIEGGANLEFVSVDTGVYKLALDTDEDTTTDLIATNGTLIVKGLDDGTYWITEETAPQGYQIVDVNELIAEEDRTIAAGENKDISIDVPNTKLASLPSTGGMGTTIFTIAGCVIMISAAGLFFASRRKAN